LLKQALDPHGFDDEADRVVRLALEEAGESFDASDPLQLHLFANGALAHAVERVLGPDWVHVVVDAVAATCRPTPDPDATSPALELDFPPSCGAPRSCGDAPEQAPRAARDVALVVSDDDDMVVKLEPILRDEGYALLRCDRAPNAVNECIAHEPALIVYDADSLEADPTRFAAEIERVMGKVAPPVMLLSKAPLSGGACRVTKPVKPRELTAGIQRIRARDKMVRDVRESGTYGLDESSPLDHLLNEALGAVASPGVCDSLVATALRRVNLSRAPIDVDAFAHFAIHAIRVVVEDALGEDAAETVMTCLSPVIEQAQLASGVRRSPIPSAVDAPTLPPLADRPPLVVLVDDNLGVLRVLERGLIQLGYDVLIASDGHAALSLCSRHGPDAVVADLHMPAISGQQFIALLKRTLGPAAPPVVILTGDAHAPSRLADVASVLYKPVSIERLADAIDGAILNVSERVKGRGH
jgi:DNA-binding response OmpR family regulator